MTLPTDYDERKALPLWTYMFEYFPLAWLAEIKVAVAGDKQHKNTGKQIQWAREKSTDQLNTALRHQFDYGMGQKYDVDGQPHLAKAIWRLKAQLQLDEEERLITNTPKNYGTVAYPCSVPPPSSSDATRRTEGRQRNVLWDDEITPPIRPSSSDATPQPLLCLCGYTVCKKCQHPS